MNAPQPAAPPSTADLDAARLLLARMGLSARDLLDTAPVRPPVPTFAEYVPVVAAAVGSGTRRVYGSYWNRILDHWAERRLDDPTPSEIKQLVEHTKHNVVARRNARGGRSAGEHLVAALRCLYRHAEHDGRISPADNPARKVAKPRRLPSTRRAVADTRLAEINHIAATTGNDPALDTLLLRLHIETACRRGGALGLRPQDLDPAQCLIFLREKGEAAQAGVQHAGEPQVEPFERLHRCVRDTGPRLEQGTLEHPNQSHRVDGVLLIEQEPRRPIGGQRDPPPRVVSDAFPQRHEPAHLVVYAGIWRVHHCCVADRRGL
jgi:hypothetical protein